MRLEITKSQQVKIVIIMSVVFYAIWHFGRAYQIRIDDAKLAQPYDAMGYVCSKAGGTAQVKKHEMATDKYVYAFACVYADADELQVGEMEISGIENVSTVTVE